jgi:hypothetical protein
MPDAPALTLIGVNSSKIQEPASASQLGAALSNSVSSTGTLQSGVALEISLRAFGVGSEYISYSSNYWTRFASRLSLSLATAQSPTVTTTILGAAGLRIVFIDGTDPLAADWATHWTGNELRAAQAACPALIAQGGGVNPDHKTCVTDALTAYKLKYPVPTAPWNAAGLALAAASSVAFANGALSQGSAAETSGWLTGSIPIGSCAAAGNVCAQISAAAQYIYNAPTTQNISAGALRLRGGSNAIRGSLEADYATANPYDIDNRKGRLLLGVDIKLTTGTWLNVNVGGDYNFSGSPVGLLSLASLKYAFASSPDIPGAQ